jgi:hypothetical protein
LTVTQENLLRSANRILHFLTASEHKYAGYIDLTWFHIVCYSAVFTMGTFNLMSTLQRTDDELEIEDFAWDNTKQVSPVVKKCYRIAEHYHSRFTTSLALAVIDSKSPE